MIKKTTKLRWRRRVMLRRRRVEDIGYQAEEHLERHLIQRFSRLVAVRRFVIVWLCLLVILIAGVVAQARALGQYYLKLQPAAGGIYTEGIVGAFTNANPLYATSLADTTVSRLVFSGLLKFDGNSELVGDLAESFTVDPTGLIYTVKLKPNIVWHDGTPLTADDVLFTYQTIQNPDARSPLFSSWQGIGVAAADSSTVVFTLPNTLAAFPMSMVNGIVPRHVLENVPKAQLRSVAFNTSSPVGSGPFSWKAIEVRGGTPADREEIVALAANPNYYDGAPKLSQFVIRTFRSEERLGVSLQNRELTAAVGLNKVPDAIRTNDDFRDIGIPVNGEVMVFFKNSQPVLSDVKVRLALTKAAKPSEIITGLGYPVIPAKGPLLQKHIGYAGDLTQFGPNIDEANMILDGAGWVRGNDGMRSKEGVPLSFFLTSQNNSEYSYVAGALQSQWALIGAKVELVLPDESEFQETISQHGFDALLYGIAIGNDPDVFPFWHSSQADRRSNTRLNFSEYRSGAADASLEAGRTRSDATLRAIKYRQFLDAWRNDAPALALYQPRFLYVTYGDVYNLDLHVINSSADRLNNVANWMIREERTIK